MEGYFKQMSLYLCIQLVDKIVLSLNNSKSQETMEAKVHEGRYELGESWTQKKVSQLE